jgi:filamentous hemagglutinin family protein
MPVPVIRLKFLLLAATALTAPAFGQELPTGASVQSGSVGIATPGPGAMTIDQSSQKAIINWQSFSIGKGGVVDITQPNTQAALLNRVTGSATSTIAGSLSANGQVFIVNPNGIAITGSGTVNAGGFVASTLGISDADFKAGN